MISQTDSNLIWSIALVVWLVSSTLWLAASSGLWLSAHGRYPSLRLGVVLLMPACLVFAGATEIYWGWLALATATAAGKWLVDWIASRQRPNDQDEDNSLFRFSTKTLLVATAASGWLVFVMTRTTFYDWKIWWNVFMIAILFALMSVVIYAVRLTTRKLSFPVCWSIRGTSLFLVVLVTPLMFYDEFLPTLFSPEVAWPPAPLLFGMLYDFRKWWMAVGGVFVLLLLLFPFPTWITGAKGITWAFSTTTALLIALLPAWIGFKLLAAPTFTAKQDDAPNAYEAWVTAGNAMENSTIVKAALAYSDWSKVPAYEQTSALIQTKPLMDELRDTLEKPAHVPLKGKESDLNIDNGSALRTSWRVTRAFGESTVYFNPDEALEYFLLGTKMDANLQHDGLMINSLIGMAIGGDAIGRMKIHLKRFSLDARHKAVHELTERVGRMEHIDVILDRDIRWCNSIWWISRLHCALYKLDAQNSWQMYVTAHKRHMANYQMIMIEFLVQNYWDEHGQYPESLSQAVSEDLAFLLVDPFAQDGTAFRYVNADNGFLLYSVGENGIDDGGDFQPDHADDFIGKDHSLERHLFPFPADALWNNPEPAAPPLP